MTGSVGLGAGAAVGDGGLLVGTGEVVGGPGVLLFPDPDAMDGS